ncbi:hypothetical protein ACFYXM_10685 [Streptomyces sp. NPDC002476]|uniref:hypothetical protein n=1 Tax=Streptomyces sp. NPDC002476 TaxID=3364648 RepID=UPI0036AA4AED
MDEWQTNPHGVEIRRYGTGPHYRAQVLKVTGRPTMLSERGGPFDLHHTPSQTAEQADGDDRTSNSAQGAKVEFQQKEPEKAEVTE